MRCGRLNLELLLPQPSRKSGAMKKEEEEEKKKPFNASGFRILFSKGYLFWRFFIVLQIQFAQFYGTYIFH